MRMATRGSRKPASTPPKPEPVKRPDYSGPISSLNVRSGLVEALTLDLVGPSNSHPFARELLPESPTRWYLTGFLVPRDAPSTQKVDETVTEEIDAPSAEVGGTDDGTPPDRAASKTSYLPSSMGLSVLVPQGVTSLETTITWGDYALDDVPAEPAPSPSPGAPSGPPAAADPAQRPRARRYRRHPREQTVQVDLSHNVPSGERPRPTRVPDSNGLTIVTTVRSVSSVMVGAELLPAGTRSVSVFLVNERPADNEHPFRAFAFQVGIKLRSSVPFVPRPDLRGHGHGEVGEEWDEKVSDLHYRDVFEYAVGHGVSATWDRSSSPGCTCVETVWVPQAQVERVAPAAIPDVELAMEALGALPDAATARRALSPMVNYFRAWIDSQSGRAAGLSGRRQETARELSALAMHAADRVAGGIDLLEQPDVLEAFRIANRSMARAARQRESILAGGTQRPEEIPAPRWRPFQLAFVLLSLRGIVQPHHDDREVVDLLFFPTGGGKTEAYLGLAAFTMVLRRLRTPGVQSAGISVLMRYTLRLLTLDQLGRATALMCALELERERSRQTLGDWPFEIGLWVGMAATPNRLGKQGDKSPGREYTAYAKTLAYQREPGSRPAPIPLENCPWCGTKFDQNSFHFWPNVKEPLDLHVTCSNYRCIFTGDRPLPVVGVDEPIYRRLPAFLIATIDKFAALPWTGDTGTLFGRVERYDDNGFYGPCHKGIGRPLASALLPPDLIIQDELHLISGPLGTIAGLYEVAIDALASGTVDGRTIRPKIVASTATVRRAENQIQALFERPLVEVFPPPGPDRRDSFFARTLDPSESPARLYIGIAAQGRSLKVILLRTALALLGAAQVAYERAGGNKVSRNPADPYMTLVGYFNSLRELGGSRRIVEDEVYSRVEQYGRRRRLEPEDMLFANRKVTFDVLELTSRVSTGNVAAAKRRLALAFPEEECVDVALATNMISVGLDIIRLGLMVVLGQPKTSAEYIQATSRVGRDAARPGLVVTLLNIHKPRDRSHYERFETFHSSFYRSVEPTSVTPFSPRALDRALPAALVALCRQGLSEMTPPLGASEVIERRSMLSEFARRFAERAQNHSKVGEPRALYESTLHRCESLLDDWVNVAAELAKTLVRLQYQTEAGGAQRL
ncbi:MAG: helicase [Candidatus Riflebacteria bacterium]|nr:helicase [Candidatus Riflebacteria bacterium]